MNRQRERFETDVLPHLDAAYNLARWLVHDEQLAQDIVQDAFMRALRYFESFRGGPARPWLLSIVRNVCNTWFVQNKRDSDWLTEADESAEATSFDAHGQVQTPETLLIQAHERVQVNAALAALPLPYREVLVLREIEEMSYEEIAQVVQVPLGTVMSRLSRACAHLRRSLDGMR